MIQLHWKTNVTSRSLSRYKTLQPACHRHADPVKRAFPSGERKERQGYRDRNIHTDLTDIDFVLEATSTTTGRGENRCAVTEGLLLISAIALPKLSASMQQRTVGCAIVCIAIRYATADINKT